jgi:hypothetical protein
MKAAYVFEFPVNGLVLLVTRRGREFLKNLAAALRGLVQFK